MADVRLRNRFYEWVNYADISRILVPDNRGDLVAYALADGNLDITTTDQVDVTEYATAQVVDENLVPENIAEDVTVLGITGTFKGIVPKGNKEITTTEPVDVTQFATAQVVDNDLTEWNVRKGASILGVSGKLQSPSFVVGNGTGAARLWYNKAFPWDDILPTLEYSFGMALIGGFDEEFIVALHVGDAYGVAYIATDIFLPIYATAPFRYEAEVPIDFPHAGWYGDYLQPPYPVMSAIMLSDIPDTLFASAEIAFGDWIKRPTETLRITQNGTYDVTGYAQVIVDVAGGGGDADPTVDGKTLIFDDTTSVDGKTLVLDTDASIDGKTLSFGEVEEEATVDGKDLVTGGGVDGKTAILDGRVEGKTLIL